MSINWYMALYYRYRDYPVTQINIKYKRNQLKSIYSNIFARLSLYFYIDVSQQHPLASPESSLNSMKSNTKSIQKFHSVNSASIHSHLFSSRKKMSNKKLKSQVIGKAQFMYPDSQLTEKELASMNIFKMQDSPIDEQLQMQVQNINNLLKIITNTSKEIISSILIQGKKYEKESSYQLNSEESSVELSNIQKSEGQLNFKKQLKQLEQISIEIIPNSNEQINFYFLEFCSKIDVRQMRKDINKQQKIDDSALSKSSLKDIVKQNQKSTQNQLDNIIIETQKLELQNSHSFLDKFQVLGNSQQDKTKKNMEGELNIMVETWLQIITLLQNSQVLYEIILELVKGPENPFVQKIVSYLHFITLINLKSLFASSISKSNFLWFLPQLLSGNRALKDFKLQRCDNLVQVYDVLFDRYIYSGQAYAQVLEKWTHIGIIISQLLIRNENIFWAKIFEDCCRLLNQYLDEKLQFSYSMVLLYESLQKQQNNCSIKLPSWKKKYYQKSIKIILERQVGFSGHQTSYSSKSEIKSKISMGSTASVINDPIHNYNDINYVFYDQKMAGGQSKITELRQWEMVLRQSIQSLKGYRKILDTGLKIFNGNSECITIFFLESYFNLKKVQVISSFEFLETVNKYCYRLTNSITYQNLLGNISGDAHPCLEELQIHKQNYKCITKKMMSNFRSKQMNTNKKTLQIGQDRNFQNDRNEEQSVCSQYQTNPQNNLSEDLLILDQEYVSGVITKLSQQKYREVDQVVEQKSEIIEHINTHIKLINECNFIFTVIQQNQFGCKNSPNTLINIPSKSKNLVILNSRQLVVALTKLNIQHQSHNKMLIVQTQNFRKPSSLNKALRMSSMNVSYKKNSFGINPPQDNSSSSLIDEQKILQKITQHNSCLNLIILAYYSYTKFYKIFNRNVLCEQCCFNSDQLQDHRHLNMNLSSDSKGGKQNKWHSITANKIINYCKKYQELSKSRNIFDSIFHLEKQLKMQITLNNINNQILSIFMFVASLQIDSLTFLAIFKQELISEDKLCRVKVIGKAYYDRIHQLFTKTVKCGQILDPQCFEDKKNMYLQNLLVVIVSLIQLLYQRNEECVQLVKFTELVINYFVSKTFQVSNNNEYLKQTEQLINLSKIISQSFDWNEQNMPELSQKQFIIRLLDLRTKLSNEEIVFKLKSLINEQFYTLTQYQNSSEKVEYLQRKLFYFILRQIYFNAYYDVGIFQVKSSQARKNFAMYQTKMLNFFEEIIAKDQRQFLQRKSQQLKQRSAHLKGYLLDYQKQPRYKTEERNFLMKTVCIFDKTLNILTQSREYEMKKRGSNSITVLRKNRRKIQPIYMHYVSTQFTKPDHERVKVFQNQSYYFYRAIQIYQDMLTKKMEDSQKKYSIYKQLGFSVPTSVCLSFHEKDLQLIGESKESLLALWINCEYKNLHQIKMHLSHENFLSKIQKLYIDLDVRHKVFESFKGKILNYEMQKTKIYHQYMDYIRGLKLDVYSHVTGQDPLPYFKLIHAIKLYRLDIKKKELEQKVNEQFGKNLGKWNQGIFKDMNDYHEWVSREVNFWKKMNEGSNKVIKQLFEIYGIVNKQLKRHENKNIEICYKVKQNFNKTSILSVNTKKSFKRKPLLQIK